mmetsp:Transcript_5570/g.12393  ORF Transcript_5570/g.12393 Transcript_5570/m.12393 type:complete len:121 (-) Transcript_5570:327-689(-)
MHPQRSEANQLDFCQHYPTPEIPEGLERSFPFFLDCRQPLGQRQISIDNENYVMELDCMDNTESNCSAYPISDFRFKGGIPISELLNGTVSSHFNKIDVSGCTVGRRNVPSSNQHQHKRK